MKLMRYLSALLVVCLVLFASCNDDDTLSPEQQFKADLKTIDDYLAANGVDAMKDPRGIRIKIHSLGSGMIVSQPDHTVTVSYSAYALDGTLFEEGIEEVRLSTLVTGMQIGLAMMPVGTRATLYVPSLLGYGTDRYKFLPPNSNLRYELELLAARRTDPENTQLAKDIQAIDAHLQSNNIEAEEDPTGLRYVVNQPGNGEFPSLYSKVRIQYTGKILSNGNTFFSGLNEPGSDFESRVVDYLPGLQIGLPRLDVGGKVTFYIPSVLAFGSRGAGNGLVPANANVIYEVELIAIVE